jgi:hypothetical protein
MNEPIPAPRPPAGWATTIGVLGALALTAVVTTVDAQGKKEPVLEVFEASTQAPPEVAEMERARKQMPAAPAKARPGVAELVELIGRQRGGKEELERARKGGKPSDVLAASEGPPPEVAEQEKQKPPAPPRNARPSRQELEQAIARQPGGREKLERARQGGRPDQPPPRASMADRAAEWLAWLPPLISPAYAAGELSVTVTPKVNSAGAHAGLRASASSPSGSLVLIAFSYGSYLSNVATNSAHIFGHPFTINWDNTTSSKSERPYVLTYVIVPKAGYYIVNTRAYSGPGVQLRRYQAGSYPIVQTFEVGGTADRPALVYLAKGTHAFYWLFPSTTLFYSASVDSYP